MAEIFISYARSDRPRAKVLAEAVEQRGYSVWWDPKIPPGKTFDEVIEAAIDSAKCVIVLWSKESVKSDWVKTEASEGKRRQILVPALIADVRIPLEFRRIQAADLINWPREKFHQGFVNLLSAVSEIVGRPPTGDQGEEVGPELILLTEALTPEPEPPEPELAEPKIDEHKPSEPTPPEPSKKRPILLIGAVVGVALILLVGVLLYTQQREVPSTPAAPPPAVRESKQIIDRDGMFIAYANGVVRDSKTGLEWVAGPDKEMDWYEARSWVKGLNVSGGGWRMPTVDELKTLNRNRGGTLSMTPLLKLTGRFVWSGEVVKGSPDIAWGLALSTTRVLNQPWGLLLGPVDKYNFGGRAFAVRSRSSG
jgi:hypothetical protein